jgi:hypothetical protein
MKRLSVVVIGVVACMAMTSSAFAANTTKGPFGPVSFQDYGSCGNVWANLNDSTTYAVGALNNDGTYNVKVKLAGGFVSVEGHSPGACNTGSDNGNTIINNIKGHDRILLYIAVSDGTFDTNQTCDTSCATDYSWSGINTFVTRFFGESATWSFSTVKDAAEKVTSKNQVLCANRWDVTYNPTTGVITSASGDIATHCSA